MTPDDQIVHALFATNALRISPPDKPFFYTSGTLGPYYINTHFLYGSESEALELLNFIESAVLAPDRMTQHLMPCVMRQYRANATYRSVIDALAVKADGLPADFISGGERRDFFFSLPLANLLGKPHVSILKTGQAYGASESGQPDRLLQDREKSGQNALHVSDLVTEASSYVRAWIPAIDRLGASMPHTLTVVDRAQGGSEVLHSSGTVLHALTVFGADLFDQAKDAGLITTDQHRQVLKFISDPQAFQIDFLAAHPDFLDEQIRIGGKTAERAMRMKERFHVG